MAYRSTLGFILGLYPQPEMNWWILKAAVRLAALLHKDIRGQDLADMAAASFYSLSFFLSHLADRI